MAYNHGLEMLQEWQEANFQIHRHREERQDSGRLLMFLVIAVRRFCLKEIMQDYKEVTV